MIHFAITGLKRRIIEDFLALQGAPLARRFNVVDYEELARDREIPRGTWILSDLDALGECGTVLARSIRDAVRGSGHRVLNDPDHTLGRYDLLKVLHTEGVNPFRAVRAGEDWEALRYPVFVRGASDHFGPVSDLLASPEEVRATLDRADRSGVPAGDLIVVEFEDTRGEDGTYVKLGAYVVGEDVIPQHLYVGTGWMIKHSHSLFTEEITTREFRYVSDNPHEERLRQVLRLAGAEYGRVDYSVVDSADPDSGIRIWEINLCPIVDRSRSSRGNVVPDELRPLRQPTKDVFYAGFLGAFDALDKDDPTGSSVPLDVPDDVRSGVAEEIAPATGGAGLMQLLRARTLFNQRW